MSLLNRGEVLSIDQWYRFLDARSDDEALCELKRLAARLNDVHTQLDQVCRQLNFSPDGSIEEDLRVARIGLSEGLRALSDVADRFRRGERHQSDAS